MIQLQINAPVPSDNGTTLAHAENSLAEHAPQMRTASFAPNATRRLPDASAMERVTMWSWQTILAVELQDGTTDIANQIQIVAWKISSTAQKLVPTILDNVFVQLECSTAQMGVGIWLVRRVA